MRNTLLQLAVLAGTALTTTACLGALALDDFVDLDDRDGRVPGGPLATLEAGFVGLPPTHLDTVLWGECAGVTPDQTRLVTAGDRVRVWDVDSGELLLTAGAAPPDRLDRTLCASSREQALIAVTDAGRVEVYDTASGALRTSLGLPRLRDVDLSLSGRWLVATSTDTAALVDLDARTLVARLDVATDAALAAAFSPDETRLAILDSRDGSVAIYSLHGLDATGRLPHERLRSPAADVAAVAWADDHTLLALSRDPAAELGCAAVALDLSTGLRTERDARGACLMTLATPYVPWLDDRERHLTTFPTGTDMGARINPEGLAQVQILDPNTGEGEARWQRGVGRPIDALAFFDDAPNLLARSTDGTIRTWNPLPGESETLLDTKDDGRPDSPMAITDDARQAVYGPSRERLDEDPDAAPDAPAVSTIAVSGASGGSGTGAMAVNQNGTLIVKSLVTGRTLGRFAPRPAAFDDERQPSPASGVGAIGAIAIDEDADWIAAQWRAMDGREGIGVLDVGQQRRVYELLDDGRATALTFVEGDRYASAHADGRIMLRTAASPNVVDELTTGAAISTLAASNDGQVVAAGLGDGRLLLWVPETGATRVVTAHERPITAVRFSTHDDLVATGDAGGLVQVWSAHVTGGTPLEVLAPPAELTSLAPLEARPPEPAVVAARVGAAAGARLRTLAGQRWQDGQ